MNQNAPAAVSASGSMIAEYEITALPPSLRGGLKFTTARYVIVVCGIPTFGKNSPAGASMYVTEVTFGGDGGPTVIIIIESK